MGFFYLVPESEGLRGEQRLTRGAEEGENRFI